MSNAYKSKLKREQCLSLIIEKSNQLSENGAKRYPCRSDFTDDEVSAIKAFFGPWPRALEAAGIKPKRTVDRLAANREKRIRSKRARRLAEKSDK